MRRIAVAGLVIAVVVALAIASIGTAEASIALNPAGAGLGSASVVFSGGTSVFSNPASGFGPVPLTNVIIEKTFGSPSPIVFDNVTFAATDLNFYLNGNGLRWTERVHNNSGVAWDDYHLVLSETDSTWFTDLPVFTPGLVTINNGGSILAAGGNTVTRIAGDGVIAPNLKEVTFNFATPVASGSFFDIHTAIVGLPNGGSFELAQTPSTGVKAVPEPASLIVWSLLGAGCAAAAARRRRRPGGARAPWSEENRQAIRRIVDHGRFHN